MLAAAKEMSTSIGTTASLRTSVCVDRVPRLNDRRIGSPRHRVPSGWA
jgi:hypothetical protein